MTHALSGNTKLLQALIIITILLISMTKVGYARGYGSGGGEGQNYNDYTNMSTAEARFFARHDSDNNGFLSIEEAIEMGMSVESFKQSDIDQNGRISRTEFIKTGGRAQYQ